MNRLITDFQNQVLNILWSGGKLYYHIDDCTVSLHDAHLNDIRFTISTFRSMLKKKLIKETINPSLNTESYVINLEYFIGDNHLHNYKIYTYFDFKPIKP